MASLYDVINAVHAINDYCKKQEKADESKREDGFDGLINDSVLKAKTKELYCSGHYARSVEEAYKLIDYLVKQKTGLENSTLSGSKLMRHVFSVDNPLLEINKGNNQYERDERIGYMDILAGVMTGIRNPRAHDSDWIDTEQTAIELLVFADHLIGIIRRAKNVG